MLNDNTIEALKLLADFLSSGGQGVDNLKGYFEFLEDDALELEGAEDAPKAPSEETKKRALEVYKLLGAKEGRVEELLDRPDGH